MKNAIQIKSFHSFFLFLSKSSAHSIEREKVSKKMNYFLSFSEKCDMLI